MAIPAVHAAENNTIRLALVGCGGRGTGAAANALATKSGPIKLVAMADVFEHRLKGSYRALKKAGAGAAFLEGSPDSHVGGFDAAQVDVPPERQFLGFDAYQKAMDCLGPGDIVILTTPCAFRWVHFGRAIEKGLNVFMEKPITVDGPGTRKMLALAGQSSRKNLKVGVGLMCRHCKARLELVDRIGSGQIGDITFMRTYRLVGPAGFTAAEAGASQRVALPGPTVPELHLGQRRPGPRLHEPQYRRMLLDEGLVADPAQGLRRTLLPWRCRGSELRSLFGRIHIL